MEVPVSVSIPPENGNAERTCVDMGRHVWTSVGISRHVWTSVGMGRHDWIWGHGWTWVDIVDMC